MSVTFSSGFHLIKPGVRVSGDQITAVIKGVYPRGIYAGKKYLHIDLAEEEDLSFVEEGVTGPTPTVADVDAVYDQLKAAGMIELFEGMLVDVSDVSVITVSGTEVKFDFRGHQPYIFDRNPDAAATEIEKLANQTWLLPQGTFDAAATTLAAADGSEELEFVSIENRLGLLEAINGLIKQDYNYITLVGTPSPDPGQVGVDSATPSTISMIVLPKTDADGKTLTFDQFVDGDRMGLKQTNGSAALYALDPVLDTGDHIRFNATLLALGYYEDQDFVFDSAVTAVIEDNSTRTSAAGVMGVSESAADLGTFTGSVIADGSNIKAALQSLETALEDGDAGTLAAANAYTDTGIANVIGAAPAVLDTLAEIASAINDDANVYTTLVSQITAVQSDVDGNEADSDAAEAALSGRLDTLEADPVTKTYVDAADTTLQSNIDSEAGTRASADSALDARLDVLEADPTTATAVAAVQADVDQNESDADAAIALKLDASAVSAYGLTLVDDADAATARTTLGLGTAATTDASAYATAAQGALADTAVQPAAISNVDNTSDADKPVSTATQTALDLKADLAGATFSGDVTIDEGTGSTIKLETSDATSAGIHIEGPTGSMGYIDTTNGFGNDSLQIYAANFWVRAINGGTGNVIIDGNISAPGVPGPYTNDGDAASNGVAVNSLYYDGNGHVHIRLS